MDIQDSIEDSLDELDKSFKIMNEILQKPIFFDSIEVRQCITEIKNTRQIIINIANRLTSFGNNNLIDTQEVVKNESKEKDA